MIKTIIFDFSRTIYDPEKGDLYPEIKPLLSALKAKYKLALISFGGSEREKQIEQLNLNKFFDYIVVTYQKDKDVFKQCLQKLGAKVDETVVIGDQLESEIRIGKDLGIATIWLKKGGKEWKERKWHFAKKLSEIS